MARPLPPGVYLAALLAFLAFPVSAIASAFGGTAGMLAGGGLAAMAMLVGLRSALATLE